MTSVRSTARNGVCPASGGARTGVVRRRYWRDLGGPYDPPGPPCSTAEALGLEIETQADGYVFTVLWKVPASFLD